VLRRLVEKSGLVFAIVFAWKVALLLFTAQPVPNNDAFFYDGPVVNLLLHGQYCNPSLVHALPISGGEVFSAYPPLYQLVLLGWMGVLGTSALVAMWLHVVLLAIYFLVVLATFRRLQVPALATQVAGLFLFGITFHDRPDTVAHVLGVVAVWALVRGGKWAWLAAVALFLAFCASLQVGGVYLLCAGMLAFGNAWGGRNAFPWAATAALGLALVGAVSWVRWGYPHLWAGFQEHVRITPSLTEWRWPNLLELLKTVRTAPGIFAVAALMVWALARKQVSWLDITHSPLGGLAMSGTLAALAIVAASLVKISPNTVHITNYLQPVVVGAFLGAGVFVRQEEKMWRAVFGLFVLVSLVTGIRAVGMTTWGVACARDVSQREALHRVRAEVDALPPGSTVIASSAYLYDLAGRTNLHLIHNDWPAAPGGLDWESQAYALQRPAKIILTQFDFHRRFGVTVERLKAHPELRSLQLTNLAGVPPPDAFPKLQRVVQHVSWAPVIVDLTWR
jgi:hypothetical protein